MKVLRAGAGIALHPVHGGQEVVIMVTHGERGTDEPSSTQYRIEVPASCLTPSVPWMPLISSQSHDGLTLPLVKFRGIHEYAAQCREVDRRSSGVSATNMTCTLVGRPSRTIHWEAI